MKIQLEIVSSLASRFSVFRGIAELHSVTTITDRAYGSG
jgi:hypothetical protein